MKITTTLNAIRKCSPCTEVWAKLLASLNKTKADDEVLELSHILESNGFDDALWCLRAVEGIDKEARLFAVFCARQIQHLSTDPRVSTAIDVAEKYALGKATEEELSAAYAAAYAAAYVAAYAAAASDAAASDAAAYAAGADVARAASAAAARAAAYTAAYTARVGAAYTAAYTARVGATYAADYAAADDAAYAAAYAAIREEQKQKFIEMFC